MDKLTLDTNILRDWSWCEGISSDKRYNDDENKRKELNRLFSKLKTLRDTGKCKLGVTTQLYTDYNETRGKLPQELESMIGTYVDISIPAITTFPIVFPLVFAEKDELEKIFKTTFPHSLPNHRKYDKNRKDALQLYAHKIADRDFFLTNDDGIFNRSIALATACGIQVKTLDKYITEKKS